MEMFFEVHNKLSQGGDWLGAARSWMQSNVPRGDTLGWSSGELVTIPFCKFEEMAMRVAVAAVIEDRMSRNKTPNVELSGCEAVRSNDC